VGHTHYLINVFDLKKVRVKFGMGVIFQALFENNKPV